ncbi:hypothetical protein [Castellaniella sp. MT123]|uniref:hypothetical protein n=1 Tax=Castellaniella sp. MT123 TaxID=3140381 RepID=UPI0031F41903
MRTQDYWEILAQEAIAMIRSGDSKGAIGVLEWDLEFFGLWGLKVLMSYCPREDHAAFVECLSTYINRTSAGTQLIAAPVLLCVHPSRCYRNGSFLPQPYPQRDEFFTLPTAEPGMNDPGEDLHFLGWASTEGIHPRVKRQLAEGPAYGIPWGRISAAVAVFEWEPGSDNRPMPTVPDEWWGEQFDGRDVITKIFTPMMLDYARAAEAARALEVGASRYFAEKDGHQDWTLYHFTKPALQHLSNYVGLQFRAQCEEKFPQHPSWL